MALLTQEFPRLKIASQEGEKQFYHLQKALKFFITLFETFHGTSLIFWRCLFIILIGTPHIVPFLLFYQKISISLSNPHNKIGFCSYIDISNLDLFN